MPREREPRKGVQPRPGRPGIAPKPQEPRQSTRDILRLTRELREGVQDRNDDFLNFILASMEKTAEQLLAREVAGEMVVKKDTPKC